MADSIFSPWTFLYGEKKYCQPGSQMVHLKLAGKASDKNTMTSEELL